MVTMATRSRPSALLLLPLLACSGGDDNRLQPGPVPAQITSSGGGGQIGLPGSPLPALLSVLVTDATGNPVADVKVTWSVLTGGGTVVPATSSTNTDGVATTQFILGPAEGDQQVQALIAQLHGSAVVFNATATADPPPPPPPPPAPPPDFELTVAAGGNNVSERFSSDLWVHGGYAYTGTWGGIPRGGRVGNVLKIWALDAAGAPTLVDSIKISDIATVSDVEVSSDGQLLMFSAENGLGAGLHLYSLADPAKPTPLAHIPILDGIHTATFSEIDGRLYAFAAKNPFNPELEIFDVTNPVDPPLVATVGVPDNYGIHDTFVRDGLAFVFAWDTGVIIYDVGNGIRGGSPIRPVEVGRLVTSAGDAGSPSVHNGWWFHNPVSGERRYLFIGQEGPSVIGSRASGDIFVVDVSDLTRPREVAFFHLGGAGAHNFWMDEERQILYAAYYNGGVVALDVSGTLSGNLANRQIGQIRPGGPGNTFTWGVQLANGSLYATD
ncbi:MAG TPA: Ig-like domain-containing protein, partial [Gemmatimonadales bacterium]|nr:Ig-like domain-containing protein [Gemmatimonadales bacterium]